VDVGGAMAGAVSTYEVAGKQYLAFNAGNISRNAFGDLGFPSVVIMALDPGPARALDITGADAAGNAVALGQRLYGQVCQACHGADGNQIADHRLGGLATRQPLAATIDYIKRPKAPMPALYPQLLDEADVAAVAAWVHEELRQAR
jgi:mono/diheme cytochrome c family protein